MKNLQDKNKKNINDFKQLIKPHLAAGGERKMAKRKVEDIGKIKKRFPKEWVLLANYEFDKMNRLSKGAVIAHSKKRDDIYRKQMKYKEPLAIDYTGPIPKDLVVMF